MVRTLGPGGPESPGFPCGPEGPYNTTKHRLTYICVPLHLSRVTSLDPHFSFFRDQKGWNGKGVNVK